jgi:hypothetical protein
MVLAGAALILPAFVRWCRRGRRRWLARLLGRRNPTQRAQSAVLWGCGGLMTLAHIVVHRYYMLVTFPFEYLWLARLALARRRQRTRAILAGLVVAQLIVSVGLLVYVHQNGGAPQGDYGVSFSAQERAQAHPLELH